MNYLAHLYLADPDPDALIGSLMGDFVKGRVGDELRPALRRGVILHRRVDSFTDAHPAVLQSKRRMRPEHRRYAGILVDVFYDHFLARGWSQYAEVSLDDFADSVYRIMEKHELDLPARMQRSMRYMVRNRLLQSYRSTQGIGEALGGIETRLKRPVPLRDAVKDLEEHYGAFREDFDRFFPQLIDFVRDQERLG